MSSATMRLRMREDMTRLLVCVLVALGALANGCAWLVGESKEISGGGVYGSAAVLCGILTGKDAPKHSECLGGVAVGASAGSTWRKTILLPKTEPGCPSRVLYDRSGRHSEAIENPTYRVWYGTNRKPHDRQHSENGFSGERDEVLHYGNACIYIPKSHKFGSVGSGWVERQVFGEDDRLKIYSIIPLDGDQFVHELAHSLRSKAVGSRKALIYIHGYNVSFEDAVIRAAQLGTDLKVEGVTAVYSWPSKGSLVGYPADEATSEGSEQFLKEFLNLVALESGAEEVDVIAHSMGNRAFLRAIETLAPAMNNAGKKFGQIFLAAPDVDADTFKRLATLYPSISKRTTMYVSSKDLALKASEFLHGYYRAGFYPPVLTIPGIDTVQVTKVDLTFLGHDYFSTAETVINDMFILMHSNLTPQHRIRLLPRPSETRPAYWEIGH